MPLYEYQCLRCHRRVEKIQSFSAEPLRVCEACGGPLEKLISASAFQFKGSGWYATDYAKKSGVSSPAASEATSSETPAKDANSAAKDSTSSPAPTPAPTSPASAPTSKA